jgi:hypothetical protein
MMNTEDIWMEIDGLATYLFEVDLCQKQGLQIDEQKRADAQYLLEKLMRVFVGLSPANKPPQA